MIAIINLVDITYFFETIYCDIFENMLATDFKNEELVGLVLTYFGIIEING